MAIKKSLLVAGAVTSIGLAGFTGVSAVSAASDAGGNSLASKIAQKFNLKEAEVQAVFDEDRAARQTKMQAAMAERLQTAVDEGKITAAQKTLIENKMKEVQATHESEREALKSWATEKGINLRYLMMGRHDSAALQDAVDEGKLTAEQKTAIEQKQSEMQNKHEEARDALEQWAEDNDIDEQYFLMRHGGGHHGPGRHF